ncbi:MAG: hypothetical protein KH230_20885 [Enterocloster asparagiformis]|nr:hypothetical protein [Enterocloster asparagiformis]
MRKSAVSVLVAAGLMCAALSGCKAGESPPAEPVTGAEAVTSAEAEHAGAEGTAGEAGAETADGAEDQETKSEEEQQILALPYQFVRKYGIIKSEYPVYELDAPVEHRLPEKEKNVSLTFAVGQGRELIASMVMMDDSEIETMGADEEPPADGMYHTLLDGTKVISGRYQDQLWESGEGLFLTGPGLPEDGIKPQKSMYVTDVEYFGAYGQMRYIILARFEIPPVPGDENELSGYALRLLDFEKPLEFTMKRAPEYGTLEELAEKERATMDTHDGISIISMGERVKEGILVSWYLYSEEERRVSITYTPPFQKVDWPVITNQGKEYPIKQLRTNPYLDNPGFYRLSEVRRYGLRLQCMFDVPPEERSKEFQMEIPGITFLDHGESRQVTLAIPEDYEALSEDITWKEGSVRILGITRMKEPQTVESASGQGETQAIPRPAVYIDVAAVHGDKNLALRRLFCQRKRPWTGWEHERYDFDDQGNLSGFRVFYEEGDESVTLKFDEPAFYWNQPYVMELVLPD